MAAPKPKATAPPEPIKVRALKIGYYDDIMRRIGDVFIVKEGRAMKSSWWEEVDPDTPEKITSHGEVLMREHDEIALGRIQARQAAGPTGGLDPLLTGRD